MVDTPEQFLEWAYRIWPKKIRMIEQFHSNYDNTLYGKQEKRKYEDLAEELERTVYLSNEYCPIPNIEYRNTARLLKIQSKGKNCDNEEELWWGLSGALVCAAASLNLWTYEEMKANPDLAGALSVSVPLKTLDSLQELVNLVRSYLDRGPNL